MRSVADIPPIRTLLPPKLATLMRLTSTGGIESLNQGEVTRIGDMFYINSARIAHQIAAQETQYYKSLTRRQTAERAVTVSRPFARGSTVDALRKLMLYGPITAETDRKWIALHNIMKQYIGVAADNEAGIRTAVQSTVKRINDLATAGEKFDTLEILKLQSLEAIFSALLGIDVPESSTKYFGDLTSALAWTILPSQMDMDADDLEEYEFDSGLANATLGRGIRALGEKINDKQELGKANLEAFAREVMNLAEVYAQETGKPNFLQAIANAVDEEGNKIFTPEDIEGIIHQLISAGYETISGVMTAAMHEMYRNKEIYYTLLAELEYFKQEFPDTWYQEYMNANDTQLDYLRRETLRFYPPTYLVPSKVEHEDGVTLGEYHFEAGTEMQIVFWNIHRDPEFFNDPEVFDPNRFDPNHPLYNPNYKESFMPYWEGPRRCSGSNLADEQFKAFIIGMLDEGMELDEVRRPKIKTMTGVTTPTAGRFRKAKAA